ncbi:hypothetical protein JXA70_06420, partial [candidate division KSB1 bacterium]|nr:hypothetical protein [candidate division KSB1 bacterium]
DDAAVDALVRLINQAQEEQKRDIVEFVEEKFERRLSEEISGLEVRLFDKIAHLDIKLSQKIAESHAELSAKIAESYAELSAKIADSNAQLSAKIADSDVKASSIKAELIKWMFIFWVGQVAVIVGILFAFFKR